MINNYQDTQITAKPSEKSLESVPFTHFISIRLDEHWFTSTDAESTRETVIRAFLAWLKLKLKHTGHKYRTLKFLASSEYGELGLGHCHIMLVLRDFHHISQEIRDAAKNEFLFYRRGKEHPLNIHIQEITEEKGGVVGALEYLMKFEQKFPNKHIFGTLAKGL